MPTPTPRRWRTSATTAQHAKTLRKTMTLAEKRLWAKLRHNQLDGLHIRRQEPINRFIADFYYAPTKLVIEVDGDVHADPEQAARDAERTAWFIEHGHRVIRFTNEDVFERLTGVLEAIRDAARGGPPPNPLPSEREREPELPPL